ncbi:probable protein phosphatase CG10417 [Periplaneta americana]|uniref:probable protein phosphatase CG10417 n=1 Tax=Periplaneta americana TaxID=6978 RepID=UPI0037E89468
MDICPSEPKTDKVSTDEVGRRIICGASTMQGCRYTQEDAHSCIMEYDENTSFFAVYNGHGGHEVATYSAQHLPQYLKNSEAYKKGDYVQALKDAFLEFDATLIKPDVVAILTELASNKDGEQNSESDEEEEDVNKLYEEAEMPLEQVMAKYQNDLNPSEKEVKQGEGKPPGASSKSGSSSSSGNGSTESDGEDEKMERNKERESGVSSSSSEGQCSNSRKHLGSNEADQASSNGDSEPVKTASDETEAEKSKATMPESSGDAKIQTVSDNVHVKQEVNGETEEGVKTVKESEGVTSSSTPHENGEGKEKSLNEISSSAEVRKHAKLRPRIGTPLYCSSLGQGDSDSDDEEDESFQMPDNSDDDDDDEDDDDDDDDDDEEDEGDTEEEDNEGEIEKDGKLDDEAYKNMTEEEICSMRKARSHCGCTAVVALLKGQELYVANAGDSRCIVCRKGQAIEMSLDHKPKDEAEKKRIVKAGGRICDGRVNRDLDLSRALGDHAYKQSKGFPAEEQMITAWPDVRTLTIDPAEDEFMVVASDGICCTLSNQEVVDFIRSRIQEGGKKLSQICEELCDRCLKPFGSCDNMAVVIIQFQSELANQNESKLLKHASSPSSDTAKRPKTEETETSTCV